MAGSRNVGLAGHVDLQESVRSLSAELHLEGLPCAPYQPLAGLLRTRPGAALLWVFDWTRCHSYRVWETM